MDDVETADRAVAEANAHVEEARAAAQAAREKALADAQDRADAADARKPIWQTIHETLADKTERLILAGGYLLRSSWRHGGGVYRGDPLTGSSLTFVPGDAPAIPSTVLALIPADLVTGTDPYIATVDDVHPIRQLATAPEVILFLLDGRVRVLKSRAAETVGTMRAATDADGEAPTIAEPYRSDYEPHTQAEDQQPAPDAA